MRSSLLHNFLQWALFVLGIPIDLDKTLRAAPCSKILSAHIPSCLISSYMPNLHWGLKAVAVSVCCFSLSLHRCPQRTSDTSNAILVSTCWMTLTDRPIPPHSTSENTEAQQGDDLPKITQPVVMELGSNHGPLVSKAHVFSKHFYEAHPIEESLTLNLLISFICRI